MCSLTVPFPPTNVQLDLKFIDGNVNITATWMVSGNWTYTIYVMLFTCCCVCMYRYVYIRITVMYVCTYQSIQEYRDLRKLTKGIIRSAVLSPDFNIHYTWIVLHGAAALELYVIGIQYTLFCSDTQRSLYAVLCYPYSLFIMFVVQIF